MRGPNEVHRGVGRGGGGGGVRRIQVVLFHVTGHFGVALDDDAVGRGQDHGEEVGEGEVREGPRRDLDTTRSEAEEVIPVDFDARGRNFVVAGREEGQRDGSVVGVVGGGRLEDGADLRGAWVVLLGVRGPSHRGGGSCGERSDQRACVSGGDCDSSGASFVPRENDSR